MLVVRCVALVLSGALLLGCGESRTPTYPVSGIVEFGDLTPVRSGVVEFIPTVPGPSARGKIDSQGHFVLGTFSENDGAIAGRHQVIVVQHVTGGAIPPADHVHDGDHADQLGMVDVRYSQLATTPLTATVEERPKKVRLRVERTQRKKSQR
jgi:hypothetical protein